MELHHALAATQGRVTKWRLRLMVIALLLTHWMLAASSVRHKSTTFDEIAHLTAGVSVFRTGDYRLVVDHPPPTHLWAALPVVLRSYGFPELNNKDWWLSDHWQIGRKFFYESGNDLNTMLLLSRGTMALISVALGVVVWWWSHRLFGHTGAILSLVLYAFSPTILAHAPLVDTDMVVTLCFLTAVTWVWETLHRANPGRIIGSGVAVAGLFLSKMSALLILPMAAVLVAARLIRKGPTTVGWSHPHIVDSRRHQVFVWLGVALAQGSIVVLLIWATYGFRYAAMEDALPGRDRFFTPYPLPSNVTPWQYQLNSMGIKERLIAWARDKNLLPEAYLYGMAMTLHDAGSEEAFLNGEVRTEGWWYFFPYCFLIKTPLPLLGVLLVALVAHRSKTSKTCGRYGVSHAEVLRIRVGLYRTAPLWTLFIVYSFFAIRSNLNIGDRHILPAYPVLFIFAGRAAVWLRSSYRVMRYVVPGFVALFVGSSLITYPHYLAHFNYLIGGPRHAYKHLVDSTLDWGQDLPGLKRWLDKHVDGHASATPGSQPPPVYLSYFGTGLPSYYGIHARMMSGYLSWDPLWGARLTGGVYCISATMLHQLRLLPICRWTPALESCYQNLRARLPKIATTPQFDRANPPKVMGLSNPELNLYFRLRLARLCACLRQREPDDSVGYSILIYRLSDQEVRSAAADRTAELVPDRPDNLLRLAEDCYRAGVFLAAAICYEHLFKADTGLDSRATARALNHWGSALQTLGRLDEAASVLRRGLQLEPRSPAMANDLAWILSTAPSDSLRDGREALRLARLALEVTPGKAPPLYDTLAAAHAELGQFDEACKQATIALELADKAGLKNDAKDIAARLDLYRSKKPYRGP